MRYQLRTLRFLQPVRHIVMKMQNIMPDNRQHTDDVLFTVNRDNCFNISSVSINKMKCIIKYNDFNRESYHRNTIQTESIENTGVLTSLLSVTSTTREHQNLYAVFARFGKKLERPSYQYYPISIPASN